MDLLVSYLISYLVSQLVSWFVCLLATVRTSLKGSLLTQFPSLFLHGTQTFQNTRITAESNSVFIHLFALSPKVQVQNPVRYELPFQTPLGNLCVH